MRYNTGCRRGQRNTKPSPLTKPGTSSQHYTDIFKSRPWSKPLPRARSSLQKRTTYFSKHVLGQNRFLEEGPETDLFFTNHEKKTNPSMSSKPAQTISRILMKHCRSKKMHITPWWWRAADRVWMPNRGYPNLGSGGPWPVTTISPSLRS